MLLRRFGRLAGCARVSCLGGWMAAGGTKSAAAGGQQARAGVQSEVHRPGDKQFD